MNIDINDIYKIKPQFDANYERYKFIAEEVEKYQSLWIEAKNLKNKAAEETNNLFKSIAILKEWYSQRKKEKINNLQHEINNILEHFFEGKYDLRLELSIKRGIETLELVAFNINGERLTSIDKILSGAEQQLAGYLVQAITLNSDFMVLDEAFSSLGQKEVSRIPELLEELDIQTIIIEHKAELFEDRDYPTIHLAKKDNGTYIKEVTGGDFGWSIDQESELLQDNMEIENG